MPAGYLYESPAPQTDRRLQAFLGSDRGSPLGKAISSRRGEVSTLPDSRGFDAEFSIKGEIQRGLQDSAIDTGVPWDADVYTSVQDYLSRRAPKDVIDRMEKIAEASGRRSRNILPWRTFW
jgi:hypothetical protein